VFTAGAYHYPIIIGHEFSGVTGDGRRVGVFPLLPCFRCASCEARHYETCSDYSYIGSRRDGAFAEYVAVPEWNLVELPDSVSFEEAALLEPAAVALHAVKMIDFANVHSAAVVGNGAIGRLIAKWLELKGMGNVSLVGKNDSPGEADVYIEAVGTVNSFATCVENVRPNGRIISVGNPNAGFNIGQKLYWQILRKQISVKGVWNSSYPSDWREVLDNADKPGLKSLISHRYEFESLDDALKMMYSKTERRCKVVVNLR
jgi:L-iditol 2-dehydrogenase